MPKTLSYELKPGPSDAIRYPGAGPFDLRLGYSSLGEFLPRLLKRDFVDRSPDPFFSGADGLHRQGPVRALCRENPGRVVDHRLPRRAVVPVQLSATALFQLRLDPAGGGQQPAVHRKPLSARPRQPLANPAVDWPRFGMAAWSQVAKMLHLPGQSAGGSTLATQLEKYRHSPDGLTVSRRGKIRQMISATVRAYQDGPQTLEARQNVVRDYLNSVPLSAVPGHGEVHGMAEGLRVWYGADFNQANEALAEHRHGSANPGGRKVWPCAKCCR